MGLEGADGRLKSSSLEDLLYEEGGKDGGSEEGGGGGGGVTLRCVSGYVGVLKDVVVS